MQITLLALVLVRSSRFKEMQFFFIAFLIILFFLPENAKLVC